MICWIALVVVGAAFSAVVGELLRRRATRAGSASPTVPATMTAPSMGQATPELPVQPDALKLSAYEANVGGFDEFRRDLRARLGRSQQAFLPTTDLLAQAALRHLHLDAGSDDAARAAAVAAHFCLRETDPAAALATFVAEVLGWSRPPSTARDVRVAEALEDLGLVRANIRRLRGEERVREYERGTPRRDHESRTLIVFFQRNIKEQELIVDYMTQRLDAEALLDVDSDRQWLARMAHWAMHRGPPYPLRGPRGAQRLRPEAIDEWHHRVRDFSLKRIGELGALYERGETERFYREVHERVSPRQAFDDLDRAAMTLPRLTPRAELFQELRRLHDDKSWYGFVALALTQVEGLVTEVLRLHGADARPHAALPEKVQNFRSLDDTLERSLDYFEFRLPILRNGLLHGGHLAQLRGAAREYVAHDLLHDLRFIVNWLLDRDEPSIKLRVALRDGIIEKLDGLDDAYVILDAVAQLRGKNRKKKVSAEQARDDLEIVAQVEEVLRRTLSAPDEPVGAQKTAEFLGAHLARVRDVLLERTRGWPTPFDLAVHDERSKNPDPDLLDVADEVLVLVDRDREIDKRELVLSGTLHLLPDAARPGVDSALRQHGRIRHNYRELVQALSKSTEDDEARTGGVGHVPTGIAPRP